MIKNFMLLSLVFLFAAASAHAEKYPSVGIYNNAEDGAPILPLIQSAKSTLDIEIYTMTDRTVRKALRDALDREVKVRIIQDPSPFGKNNCAIFGKDGEGTSKDSKVNRTDCKDLQKLVSEVRKAGGTYIPFKKPELCGNPNYSCYQHGKMAIADEKVALISSGNFDPSNLCNQDSLKRCNRDYTMIIDDSDVIATLKAVFEKDMKGENYHMATLLSSLGNTKLTVSPNSTRPLVEFVLSAKKSIRIQNQYLNDKRLNQALLDVTQRGVKVYVNVSSACSFNRPTDENAKKLTQQYTEFDNAGIQTRMMTSAQSIGGKNAYLHAKAIIVDDTDAWVGSVNGSVTAMANNREFGIFFDKPSWVKSLKKTMISDFENQHTESWEESLQCKKDNPTD